MCLFLSCSLTLVPLFASRRQRHPESARELEETGGEKLYMRYEVDVDKGYPRHTVSHDGTLKGAPLQLPPPGVSCDTLHLHHHLQVAPESDGKTNRQTGGPGGATSYSHGTSTLTRPGTGTYNNRQHIYESPQFT